MAIIVTISPAWCSGHNTEPLTSVASSNSQQSKVELQDTIWKVLHVFAFFLGSDFLMDHM